MIKKINIIKYGKKFLKKVNDENGEYCMRKLD